MKWLASQFWESISILPASTRGRLVCGGRCRKYVAEGERGVVQIDCRLASVFASFSRAVQCSRHNSDAEHRKTATSAYFAGSPEESARKHPSLFTDQLSYRSQVHIKCNRHSLFIFLTST